MPSLDSEPSTTMVSWATRAMACEVTIQVPPPDEPAIAAVVDDALDVFRQVEQACTRFDPRSPLMIANARPDRWHRVPDLCVAAISEAHAAHLATGGLFDPRTHDRLVALGYDTALPIGDVGGEVEGAGAIASGPWTPGIRPRRSQINLGGSRVDLGGIGKGLALRWAAERLQRAGSRFLIEAGGDCYAAGSPGEGGWRIGVEDAATGAPHVAVLEVHDLAVATSSTRIRRWYKGGRPVHHLIDPRNGEPAKGGLASVTVVHRDPAWAEVWSKALFLSGLDGIERRATRGDLAALWIDYRGTVASSTAMHPHLLWKVA